ncbi:hypothetical protein DYB26_008642, partial [Aphanomyces astaci]
LILMLVYAITDKIYTVYFTDHAVEAKTTKKTVVDDGTVCANILLRHDIFRAHCHVIAENQVDKTVIRVFRKDITLKQLFNLSLRPLA